MVNPSHENPAPGDAARRLEELIVACLERIETEGEAAAAALCAQHPEHAEALRARLQTLAAMGLIGGGGTDVAAAMPERLGDFRLLQHLGGGGMGVVYLARQESLGRDVALKLIRPEQLFFPGARERFRREVETVARLAHPGIVPIYTVGEERGVPFFAMERVLGCSLADVIERLQHEPPARLSGVDFDRAIAAATPDPAARAPAALFAGRWSDVCLRVVREVADALEHAHRRGVLHRDVKPSNVMLTRDGRVMLVDFGLSSASGGERLTRTGSLAGSLAYMAPEVLHGDSAAVDARCDVYSLGVTLYELLTLRLPFPATNLLELRRQIAAGQPRAPRHLHPSLPRDVETVCLHAMACEPRHRYASAAEFAQDLSRALERRPILARRASAPTRLLLWARRQPALASAVLLALLLVAGLPSALYLQQRQANAAIQAKNAQIEASNRDLAQALQAAETQRARAEQNLGVAMSSIDTMLARVGAQDLEQVPQFERVRARLLESALQLNEQLAKGQGDERPDARHALAETRRRTADIHHGLGRFAEAAQGFELALADRRALFAQAPTDANRIALAMVLASSARTLRALGQREASAAASGEAIELLAAVPTTGPDGGDLLEQRAHALHFRATTLFLLGQREAALAAHRESVELARQRFAREPSPDHEAAIAGHLGAMGSSLLESRDNAAARTALAETVAILDRVLPSVEAAKTYREGLADACTNLGVTFQNDKDLAAAAPYFERAFTVYAELARDYPNSPRYIDSLNSARTNLATLLAADPDTRERGAALLRDAVASQTGLVGRFPQSIEYRTLLAMMVGNLGTLESGGGDVARGIELLSQALDRHGELLREQPGNPVLQARSVVFGLKLANLHLQGGDSHAAADVLATTEALGPADWITLRRLAGQTVDASEKARADERLPAAERALARERLLTRAFTLMERAIAGGYRDVEDLEQAPLFAPLRADARYAALRARLPAVGK